MPDDSKSRDSSVSAQPTAHEVVSVNCLKVGDVIKVESKMWKVEDVQEHPEDASIRLCVRRVGSGYPWGTYKYRKTLVYRERA